MKPLCMPFWGTVFILFILALSSCTTYQYSFIKTSSRDVELTVDNDFVKEDDKVIVSYCFFGEGLPIEITVENKMDQPVFINWRESALIVEDAANSYMSNRVPIIGRVSTTTYSYHDCMRGTEVISESYGGFMGEAYLPEEMTFIPPFSRITKTPLVLDAFELGNMPKEIFKEQSYPTSNGRQMTVKAIEFTEKNSPLRFKSYLTFFTTNPAGRRNKTWSMEQSFYVSELIKGGSIKPDNFEAFRYRHGDFFYMANRKNNTYLIYGIGVGLTVISLVSFAIAADNMEMPDSPF